MKWFSRHESRYAELEDELRSHLAMSTRERVRRGESDAEFAARREFGNVTKISGEVQDTWSGSRIDRFEHALRDVIRGLLRNLGFTISSR